MAVRGAPKRDRKSTRLSTAEWPCGARPSAPAAKNKKHTQPVKPHHEGMVFVSIRGPLGRSFVCIRFFSWSSLYLPRHELRPIQFVV